MLTLSIFFFILGTALLTVASATSYYVATYFCNICLKTFFNKKISTVILIAFACIATSLPELSLHINYVLENDSATSSYILVLSNVSIVLFSLGFAILLRPIVSNYNTRPLENFILILSTLLFSFLSLQLIILPWQGMYALLFYLLIVVAYYFFRSLQNNENEREVSKLSSFNSKTLILLVICILISIVSMSFGRTFLINGSTYLARDYFGIEHLKIVLLAHAVSIPEFIFISLALYNKKSDIAIGLVTGSLLFNTVFINGVTSNIGPLFVPSDLVWFHLPFLIAIICLMQFMIVYRKLNRVFGFLFTLLYTAYVYFYLAA